MINFKEIKNVKEIDLTKTVPPAPCWPITFICGKEMIEHFGIYEPEYGTVIYLFHQSEIGDGSWLPDFNKVLQSSMHCLLDTIPFKVYIKTILDNLKEDPISSLQTLALEGMPDDE